jgi:DNA-binding FadR family transcriptional regulator
MTDTTLHHEASAPYRPQYEIVAQRIVTYIQEMQLNPGDRLPTEYGLGEQFGVSRAVVREAVKYLSATGLVGVRKGVGVYVANSSPTAPQMGGPFALSVEPEQVEALFEFRCHQEMMTVQLATESITHRELRALETILKRNQTAAESDHWDDFIESDNHFHHAIAAATHNPFFVEIIDNILRQQRWVVKLLTGGAPGSLIDSANQHTTIFLAIKEATAQIAVQAMQSHVETSLTNYRLAAKKRLQSEEHGLGQS